MITNQQISLVKSDYPCMGDDFPGIKFTKGCEKPCAYCGLKNYSVSLDRIIAIGFDDVIRELSKGYMAGIYKGVYISPYSDAFNSTTKDFIHQILEQILPKGLVPLLNTKQVIPNHTLELLSQYKDQVIVQVSIPTLYEEIVQRMEPGSATIGQRLATVKKLSEYGIPVTTLIMPYLGTEGSNTSPNDFAIAFNNTGTKRVISACGVFRERTICYMSSSSSNSLCYAAKNMTENIDILIGSGKTFSYKNRIVAYKELQNALEKAGIKFRVCGVALDPAMKDNSVFIPICSRIRHRKFQKS